MRLPKTLSAILAAAAIPLSAQGETSIYPEDFQPDIRFSSRMRNEPPYTNEVMDVRVYIDHNNEKCTTEVYCEGTLLENDKYPKDLYCIASSAFRKRMNIKEGRFDVTYPVYGHVDDPLLKTFPARSMTDYEEELFNTCPKDIA